VSGVQPEPQRGANSDPQGKHRAGCPPVDSAVRCQRDGARYQEGMAGVQPDKLACPPRDQRATDPVGLR